MDTQKRPNILWICTDQQRFDTLGCYGNKFVKTPNIDRLAASGVRFTNAYCQAPVCAPSRASMLTGRYPRICRVRNNGQDIPKEEILVTRLLHDNGYACGLSGKLHISACHPKIYPMEERRINDGYDFFAWSHDSNTKGGHAMNRFAMWLRSEGVETVRPVREDCKYAHDGMPAKYRQSAYGTAQAIEFMESARTQGMPFMFSVNYLDPHHPFDAPREYIERYMDMLDDLPVPNYALGELANKTAIQQSEHLGAYGKKGHFAYDEMTEYDHKLLCASYYALCDILDEEIGKLLDYLETSGQIEDTIIIFHSDHGESLGDHGMYLKAAYFYEASVRVPLIISWKDHFLSGAVANGLVELLDIAPTLLDVCGLAPEYGMQGRSLLPLLCGEAPLDVFREDVYCELCKDAYKTGEKTYASMLFDGRYKLVRVSALPEELAAMDAVRGELYDLATDPTETHNLYEDPDYIELRVRMLEKLCDRQCRMCDPIPKPTAPY